MIFDSISNKENYKEEKEIYQTLNFLEKLKKWDDVESNAIIQKDWISANPVSFLSKDESECMYEAHRKHIDVHYIMEGIEKIATADVKNLQEKVPFDKDKDIGFYEGCESGSYLLKTGDFMVCFPSDAHKVGMMNTLYSRDDVDAVIVATPNYLHKEPVVKAAEHGVNVFCEKPIALSYQDCDDMVRACQEHGVIFMAGHVMNFFHGVRHAKKLINDGVIGKVLYCHSARNGWEEQQPTISWKKIREKSGGHLYHHIHELDCVQFLMGGMPEEVTMTGGNVAHQGEAFGDEDDMLFVNMQFSDNRYAVLEWGSAFHWPEHYVLIQGTKGAIKIDMCDCGGTLKIDGKDEHFLVHESQEEDDDRTRIYHSTEMDGAIMYGKPGKKPPMWLHSIMKNEMKYLNGILHGKEVDEEFRPLLTGEAARAAIATADACTRSRFEDRKVKLSEIIG